MFRPNPAGLVKVKDGYSVCVCVRERDEYVL